MRSLSVQSVSAFWLFFLMQLHERAREALKNELGRYIGSGMSLPKFLSLLAEEGLPHVTDPTNDGRPDLTQISDQARHICSVPSCHSIEISSLSILK